MNGLFLIHVNQLVSSTLGEGNVERRSALDESSGTLAGLNSFVR